MSSIIRFFVADDDEAAEAAVESGTVAGAVTYGNFDADLGLLEWESLLTGRSFDEVLADSESAVISDDDEGALIIGASERLQAALGGASSGELDRVARLWAEERAREGEVLDPELALEILTELGRLSRAAEQRLYCWIS